MPVVCELIEELRRNKSSPGAEHPLEVVEQVIWAGLGNAGSLAVLRKRGTGVLKNPQPLLHFSACSLALSGRSLLRGPNE